VTNVAGFVVNTLDLLNHYVERCGHSLVHQCRLMSLNVIGRPAVAAQELIQFLRFDAREDRRVGDLVAVEVQDRQHGRGFQRQVFVSNLFLCPQFSEFMLVSGDVSEETKFPDLRGVDAGSAKKCVARMVRTEPTINVIDADQSPGKKKLGRAPTLRKQVQSHFESDPVFRIYAFGSVLVRIAKLEFHYFGSLEAFGAFCSGEFNGISFVKRFKTIPLYY
jgi:hypothetical protein